VEWGEGGGAEIYQIASLWNSCVINPWTGKRDTWTLHAWKEIIIIIIIIKIKCAVKGLWLMFLDAEGLGSVIRRACEN
jgi:hypothetical protein